MQHVQMYILREDQLWRVPAHRALWDAFLESGERWNWMSEVQKSALLGYTRQQRTGWMDAQRWERGFNWGPGPYYTLLSKQQRAEIVALGNKAFRDPTGFTFFEHDCGMKRNAAALVPKGTTIARFALRWEFGCKIVGDPLKKRRRKRVYAGVVSAELAPRINAELCSQIEFLGSRGWS